MIYHGRPTVIVKLTVYLLAAMLLCLSCDNRRTIRDVRKLYGTKIELPDSLFVRNHGIDSLFQPEEDEYASLIIWYDSIRCASCNLKVIERWNKLFQYRDDSAKGMRPMVIFSPGKRELYRFESNLRTTEFDYPIYVDYDCEFGNKNPQIASYNSQNVFLIDKSQTIVLVGDPYYNTQIYSLYKTTIHSLIENKGVLPK